MLLTFTDEFSNADTFARRTARYSYRGTYTEAGQDLCTNWAIANCELGCRKPLPLRSADIDAFYQSAASARKACRLMLLRADPAIALQPTSPLFKYLTTFVEKPYEGGTAPGAPRAAALVVLGCQAHVPVPRPHALLMATLVHAVPLEDLCLEAWVEGASSVTRRCGGGSSRPWRLTRSTITVAKYETLKCCDYNTCRLRHDRLPLL